MPDIILREASSQCGGARYLIRSLSVAGKGFLSLQILISFLLLFLRGFAGMILEESSLWSGSLKVERQK